jgi:hypothetical protein
MTNAGRLGLLAATLAACVAAVLWSTKRATSDVARQSVVLGAIVRAARDERDGGEERTH